MINFVFSFVNMLQTKSYNFQQTFKVVYVFKIWFGFEFVSAWFDWFYHALIIANMK